MGTTTTPNYGLLKPDEDEFVDEEAQLNDNWDIIDTALEDHDDRLVVIETGPTFGVGTSFVPTLYGIANLGATGSKYGRYVKNGKVVQGTFAVHLEGGGILFQVDDTIGIDLPFDFFDPSVGATVGYPPILGRGQAVDNSTNNWYGLLVVPFSPAATSKVAFILDTATGDPSPYADQTKPFGWATGDSLRIDFNYETTE